MVNWDATLAPLGVPSEDGRTLDADGEWTLGGHPAPLLYDGAVVGRLDVLVQTADALLGQGVVHDWLAARMASGELLPEIDILPTGEDVDLDDDGIPSFRFHGGRVAAVVAGTSPAFGGVSFTIGDPVAA